MFQQAKQRSRQNNHIEKPPVNKKVDLLDCTAFFPAKHQHLLILYDYKHVCAFNL